MKERPILFSAPMVRALLDGTKTQTRRVAKGVAALHSVTGEPLAKLDSAGPRVPCPYGQPGDRLWVREAFAGSIAYERHGYPLKEWGNKIWYVADGEPRSGQWTRPRPSIHMPRRLSRITLEVTGVRVERLQDISAADAQAEGIQYQARLIGYSKDGGCRWGDADPIEEYCALWESINGPGSWDANHWVWVVGFKPLEA